MRDLRGKEKTAPKSSSATFKIGTVAFAFLIIGYQSALFIHKAAVLRIESLKDKPDTVFIYVRPDDSVAMSGANAGAGPRGAAEEKFTEVRKNAVHSPIAQEVRDRKRSFENFPFDPNTASIEDLQRLGFTQKQALSIDNYRKKGGRFRRPEDFAKSFVVSDTLFERLAPWIDIPLIDINAADSATFDSLPGIGPYFASKMVEYRRRIGGYSDKRQLMDIYNFDKEKYDGLSDLITVGDYLLVE
ncbi:MAG: helix-hairpin-helix domain-containing protein [Bacteroidales bacterium]|nr:helix-hairpin-helix domain-containing protein [Bacteroidales bacterium]